MILQQAQRDTISELANMAMVGRAETYRATYHAPATDFAACGLLSQNEIEQVSADAHLPALV